MIGLDTNVLVRLVSLSFEHEDTKPHALCHDHNLREVAIPRTVIISDPTR